MYDHLIKARKHLKKINIPTEFFDFSVYQLQENSYNNRSKLNLVQFPILVDLATAGHKLQGMMKKNPP